jgi:hypothetical protein
LKNTWSEAPTAFNNPISIAVGPLNRLFGKRYYDLPGTLEVYQIVYQTGLVDGFEFQNLAEWDASTPPRDNADSRLAAWRQSQKYTTAQLAASLRSTGCPILSIHANRDAGICLCSGEAAEIGQGMRLVEESLELADKVEASACVFHLWDTWKENFNPAFLVESLAQAACAYPHIKASVENVPTHLPGATPFTLAREFEWLTLDLRFAAMYAELAEYETLRSQIANVHLSAQLDGGRFTLNPAWFPSAGLALDFYEALDLIRCGWQYNGPLTVELSGRPGDRWEDIQAALGTLK